MSQELFYEAVFLNDQRMDYTLGELVILCHERLEQLRKNGSHDLELWIDIYFETGFKIRLNDYDFYNIIDSAKPKWYMKIFDKNGKKMRNDDYIEKKSLEYVRHKIDIRFKS